MAQENFLKNLFKDDKLSKLKYEIGILTQKNLRETNLNDLDFNRGSFGSDGNFNLSDSYLAKVRDLNLETLFSTLLNKRKDLVLKDSQLSKYQSEIKGLNIRNSISAIEKAFMEGAGIKGTKDILPLLRVLLGR